MHRLSACLLNIQLAIHVNPVQIALLLARHRLQRAYHVVPASVLDAGFRLRLVVPGTVIMPEHDLAGTPLTVQANPDGLSQRSR